MSRNAFLARMALVSSFLLVSHRDIFLGRSLMSAFLSYIHVHAQNISQHHLHNHLTTK